jgi:hypothetical protein
MASLPQNTAQLWERRKAFWKQFPFSVWETELHTHRTQKTGIVTTQNTWCWNNVPIKCDAIKHSAFATAAVFRRELDRLWEQPLAGSPTSAFLLNSHLQAVRRVLSYGTATCRQSDECFLMEQTLAGSPTSAFLWNSHLQAVPTSAFLWNSHLQAVQQVLSYGTATCRQLLRLATGWTARGSNPGDSEIFCTCPDRPWRPPSVV